jgi:hypothetical protein
MPFPPEVMYYEQPTLIRWHRAWVWEPESRWWWPLRRVSWPEEYPNPRYRQP